LNYDYEGYYVTDFYKALYRAMVDKSYTTSEWLQAFGVYEGGTKASVGRWVGTRESEDKYTLNVINANYKIVWSMVPKPGTPADVENPPLVPKGIFNLNLHGCIVLDYMNVWGESPILRPFKNLRDDIIRHRIKGVLISGSRLEGKAIIESMKEFASFLPNIK